MKIFISHKKEDAELALAVHQAFAKNNVESYLDLLDNNITMRGKELTEHIKDSLNSCSDIIVVMSDATKYSWWVPFEVGMSAQVDMPTATFLKSDVTLPSFLNYWPRLKTIDDIDIYVDIRRRTKRQIVERYGTYMFANRKSIETESFYATLKQELR